MCRTKGKPFNEGRPWEKYLLEVSRIPKTTGYQRGIRDRLDDGLAISIFDRLQFVSGRSLPGVHQSVIKIRWTLARRSIIDTANNCSLFIWFPDNPDVYIESIMVNIRWGKGHRALPVSVITFEAKPFLQTSSLDLSKQHDVNVVNQYVNVAFYGHVSKQGRLNGPSDVER